MNKFPLVRRVKVSVTLNGGKRPVNRIFYPDNSKDILPFLCAARVIRVNEVLTFAWRAAQKGFWEDMRVVEARVNANLEAAFKGEKNG